MTYDPNIPQDLPPPATIVPQIRTNFSEYQSVFSNNHAALNSSNQGKHTNVIFQEQIDDPVINGDFANLFSKQITTLSGNKLEVFGMIPQFLPNDVPNTPMQLTFESVNTTATFQTFLSGGYLLWFDTIPSANNISTIITLSPAPSEILCVIPNPTKIAGIGVTPSRPIQISVTILNNFQFRIDASFIGTPPGTGDINWIAIAKQ